MPEFQCAVASRDRAEPIFATASQVRRWLLVEVRGSWGRDAIHNTDLGRHVNDEWRAQMRSAGIRVVAIRRDLDRVVQSPLRMFFVVSGNGRWRSGRVWSRNVAGLHAVLHATGSLVDPGDGHPGPTGEWTRHTGPLVLVCTNGRHDSCCATFGRPVVRALRESEHADAVWECSHIGGDRFAGNIVILPDGLYFGRCTPESGLAVVDDYHRGRLRLDEYRGRSTLGFTHQAAEFFARRQLNATAIDAITAVRRIGDQADGTFHVALAGAGGITVTVRRSVVAAPAPLTCTGPGDVTLPSYELVALEPRA